MSPLPPRGLGDGGLERRPIALGNHGADRAGATVAVEHVVEQPHEQRIGAHDAAVAINSRDRHRRIVEKAHEADFRRALRIGALVAGAIEHERARSAGGTVGAEGDLVEQANRQRTTAAGPQIEVEHLGLDLARRGAQRRQQRRTVAGNDIGKLESAGADLGEILIEPVG